MSRSTRIALLLFCVLPTLTLAQSNAGREGTDQDQLAAAIDAALGPATAQGRFSGVCAVATAGKVQYLGTFGEANVEFGVAHSPGTRFKLHSLSKPLLSATLLTSVDAGELLLDELVGAYLNDWPFEWSEVTVRHLATHTSGIPELAERFLAQWSGSALATWRVLDRAALSKLALAFEPGTGWSYSNGGYVLLAAILEQVHEKPLDVILREQLFEPAGMKTAVLETTPPWDSIAYDGARVVPMLATGYNGSPQALQVAHSKMYSIPGAGGIVASGRDLVAFAHALFTGELLKPESVEQLTTVAQGQSVPYALGWFVREREGQRVFAHDGGNNGFVTSLEYYPESQLTIVILSNRGFAPLRELRDGVAAKALETLR